MPSDYRDAEECSLPRFQINTVGKLQSERLLEDVNVVYEYLKVLLQVVRSNDSVGLSTISMKTKSLQLKLLFILFRQQRKIWIKNNRRVKSLSLIKRETKLLARLSFQRTGGTPLTTLPDFDS